MIVIRYKISFSKYIKYIIKDAKTFRQMQLLLKRCGYPKNLT